MLLNLYTVAHNGILCERYESDKCYDGEKAKNKVHHHRLIGSSFVGYESQSSRAKEHQGVIQDGIARYDSETEQRIAEEYATGTKPSQPTVS